MGRTGERWLMARRSSSVDVFIKLRGQRQFKRDAIQAGAALETMGFKGAKAMSAFAVTGDKLKSFGRSWTRNVSLPMTAAVALAGKAAVDWEDSFAGVRKTVEATEAQFASLERGLRSMALQIPVAANDLAGIAETAGQLGIKRKAILGFTRTIADLGVATNLAGEEGASTLASFANITQMPQSQFKRLGSTIVALGNAGSSTEKDIAAMGVRIAAAGHFVGMSEAHILGFSNALSSLKIEAEAGGTAISQVLKTINSAVSGGGKELESFARIAGMSSGKFAAAWRRDAAGASVAWIEGLGDLAKRGKDVPALLDQLSPKLRGARVQDTLLRLAGSGNSLRESLDLGAKSWRENNALTEEARKRYATTASKLKILKNKIVDAGISIGQDFLPPLIHLVDWVGPRIGAFADAFAALPGPVKATALGLLILTGPVASGLGYFASGIGKSLILMKGLGEATTRFNAVMSSSTMTQQSGFRGALGAAFGGTGAAGALQAAKGFALSLGAGLALYGIGSIVTSALEGDWRSAGWEAGGALVGGMAGAIIGGPLGAMVGVGIGSIGGGLLSKLFDVERELAPLQKALAESARQVERSFEGQQVATRTLAQTSKAVVHAHRRQRLASKELSEADSHLTDIRRQFGPDSIPAIRAENQFALAKERSVRATQALRRAERKRGVELQIFKEMSRLSVLDLRDRLRLLRRENRQLLARRDAMKGAGASLRDLKPINEALLRNAGAQRGAMRKLSEVYLDAARNAGPQYARFLRNASDRALRLGGALRTARADVRQMTQALRELARAAEEATSPFEAGIYQDRANTLRQALPQARRKVRGLAQRQRNRQGSVPRRRGSQRVPRIAAAGAEPRSSTAAFDFKSAFLQGRGDGQPIVVQSILDGRIISESVARNAEDEAAFA
jgi:TP901 family phage tail tape measure protein